MRRRAFLQRVGVTAAASVATAGCTDGENEVADLPDAPPLPERPDGFDESRLVDLTEHGADPTGERSITPVLEDVAVDGTVAYLPPGRYRVAETFSIDDVSVFGLVGDDATLVPAEENEDYLFKIDGRESAQSVVFSGLEYDFSAPDTGGRLLSARVADGLLVEDVSATGTADRGPNLVRIDVVDPEGVGWVENLRLLDGAHAGTGISGCYVGSDSRGDIVFEDCRIEGFPDNGLYADPPAGSMHVVDGYYANNGISNVRVRGGSSVRGVHVRIDEDHRDFDNMRGIRLTDYTPQKDTPPAVIEDCLVEIRDVTHSDGAIELNSQLAHGVVRNTHVHVDPDGVHAIRVKPPNEELRTESIHPRLVCEEVTITGSAGGVEAVRIVERNHCTLDGLYVKQTGPNRDGVEFTRSRESTLRNSSLQVTGEPVVINDSTVKKENVDLREWSQ